MNQQNNADYWVRHLALMPHPEGGFFREVYRADHQVVHPDIEGGNRNAATAIYYLLRSGDFSAFHRLKSDEVWHFYHGSAIRIYTIDEKGSLLEKNLGPEIHRNEEPLVVIPRNTWFAAEVKNTGSFALAGCTVSPGFDFADFEMADKQFLINQFPGHKEIISRLSR